MDNQNKSKMSLECNEVLDTKKYVNFGAYKGELITNVFLADPEYCDWLIKCLEVHMAVRFLNDMDMEGHVHLEDLDILKERLADKFVCYKKGYGF